MKKYNINNLGKIQLSRLRQDIVLNSLYYSDYKNRYNLDTHIVCNFFDWYSDYLSELMTAAGIKDNDFFKYIDKYDNKKNLQDFYNYEYDYSY